MEELKLFLEYQKLTPEQKQQFYDMIRNEGKTLLNPSTKH